MKMLLFFVLFLAFSVAQPQLLLSNVFRHSIIADRLHLARNESVLDQMLQSGNIFASRSQLFNLLNRNRADIHHCYDSSIGNGQQIDIFNLDIFSVVQRFFVSFK